MDHPVLGRLAHDSELGWDFSGPVLVPLVGHECRFVFDDYAHDASPSQLDDAVRNVLAADRSVLMEATEHVLAYREDITRADGREPHALASPSDVWSEVRLGDELHVLRDPSGVFVGLLCECDWEPEHGLDIVLRDGRRVTKVGAYDGHATNERAFAEPRFADVVYVRSTMRRALRRHER